MMQCIKYVFLCALMVSLKPLNSRAQADSVWMTTQGGLGTDQWNEVVLCDNNDLLVVGTTSSDLVHGNEIYLARLDALHHCIWTVTLGEFGVEWGHDVVEDDGGNIWCLATVNGSNSNAYDLLLLCFDGEGILIQQILLEKDGIQFGQKLAWNGHHQLAITGVEVNSAGGRDALYYLLDTETLSAEVFSIPHENQDLAITVTEWDSTLFQWFVAGNALITDSVYQVVGWGIDTLGNIVWENVNDPQGDSLRVFDAVWKNDYWVLAGSDWMGNNWRAQIVKWIPGQTIQKMGSFALTNGETLFHSVVHRSTGNGFVFGGWTYDMGAGLSDAYLHAFDDNFNWDGGAIFGGSKEDKINAMVNDVQGKLHWVGLNGSYNTPAQIQGWMARLNAGYVQSSNIILNIQNDQCFELSVPIVDETNHIQAFYKDGQISFGQSVDRYNLFDLQGALLRSGANVIAFPISLSSGCYLLQWQANGGSRTQKIFIH